jgi:hypothetical protein
MGSTVKTYDPGSVVLTLGAHIVAGYGPDTMITVERDEDSFTKQVGVDGETARSKNRNRGGKITITLLQTSSTNDVLSGYLLADEASNAGVVPAALKDLNGNTLMIAPSAWVMKAANSEFAKEVGTREWTIDTADMEINVGGNTITEPV